MSQSIDRDHGAGRRPAVQSHRATKESNVSNPTNVFDHTGWHLHGDQHVYLHSGGAIGPSGPVADLAARLDGDLDRFTLPAPPNGDELRAAVRASLSLLDLATEEVSTALLAMVYRAPLGHVDFSGFLVGPSGAGKSELAALVQQHYGADMDRRNLPGSWHATEDDLQQIAHQIKDAVLVFDDFVTADLHHEVERLLRVQSNSSAPAYTSPPLKPGGLLLCSGENVPAGESLSDCVLALDVQPGDVHQPTLTLLKEQAALGMLATAMAGHLRWLVATHGQEANHVRARVHELMLGTGDGADRRVPHTIASLAVGLERFLQFAEHVGAIDASDREEEWSRGVRNLIDLGELQANHFPNDPTAGGSAG